MSGFIKIKTKMFSVDHEKLVTLVISAMYMFLKVFFNPLVLKRETLK